MIPNVFPETLSKLLLALCPNITSSGIQFATAQLPQLDIMDCGMTICDPNLGSPEDNGDSDIQKIPNSELHRAYKKLIIKHSRAYQMLIIKHSRLKKLSLWGCFGLDAGGDEEESVKSKSEVNDDEEDGNGECLFCSTEN
ncbi:PREDICTED: F-box/LRR-repeat protein 17-like isoform X1 [Ipomoea nil]|uniref:F-box/LRR-repeat protein 17-like isoform X1 n=1 Tax=Ipomoea nil TaxID=35883 RepID=UPI000900CE03|nr:PREDICTED: F-box/LRR-repeat protein 17-like isoform X1 [Ipomoea nil]